MIEEHSCVILEVDIPECGLARGDVGAVALTHSHGQGYEVEFCALDGETLAVVSVTPDQIRPAHKGEILHSRLVTS